MSETPRPLTLNIASGASASGVLNMANIAAGAVLIPETWTAANLAVQGSANGTDFFSLQDQYGTLISIVATAGRASTFSMAEQWSVPFIRFVSVSATDATTAANQAGARVLTVFVR